MRIVIEFPKEVWERYVDLALEGEPLSYWGNLIANGTPLPKGHGRLIDADRLRSMYSINRANFNTVVGIQKWVDNAPTILEADKEENND